MLARILTVVFLLTVSLSVRADKVLLVAGGESKTDGVPATQFKLIAPFAIGFDQAGNYYIAEMTGNRVHRVDQTGKLTIIGGTGEKGNDGDNGPARKARFNGMHHLVVDADGHLLLADTWNHRIRRLDPKTGVVTPFAGTGKKGFSGDGGPARNADFGGIYCLAFDPPKKNLYVADLDNRRIRVINMATGIVTTVAGNGKRGVPPDGAIAKNAPLVDPRAVAVDSKGNVYILERGGHALRVVGKEGKIRTVAGTGKKGFSGDGGPALKAMFNGPKHLCVDLDDNVLIADTENHVIRKYLPKEGRIVRIAGTGKRGKEGVGGPPLKVQLAQPHGVFQHKDGSIYIVDSSNNRVLKIVKE